MPMHDGTPTQPSPKKHRLPGKPRIAIMGEFSAGKSTLSNMLIGHPALPTKVTATQLPPVWIAEGDGAPLARGLDGDETPFELNQIGGISPHGTEYIRLFDRSETLELFDLIDMPGISDPNIPSEVWERVMDIADAVIWCTHATQAWRQSEAAVWEGYADALASKSILLVTRFDKILGQSDRRRVLHRMHAEAGPFFRAILPISLTQALDAETDPDLWSKSGAADFAAALVDLSRELSASADQGREAAEAAPLFQNDALPSADQRAARPLCAASGPAVMPRRVQPSQTPSTRPARPPREDADVDEILPRA